jgi:hypothetical protein
MVDWLKTAFEPRIVRRSLKYAAVVGTILITINHGNAILSGAVDRVRIFQMCLTVVVPYCVSTLSSVEAIRSIQRGAGEGRAAGEAARPPS